jgi:hypothetical protein
MIVFFTIFQKRNRIDFFEKTNTKLLFFAYNNIETAEGGVVMCQVHLRKMLGISVICFGAGILLSFLLPGYILAFIEAAVVIASGFLLLSKHR